MPQQEPKTLSKEVATDALIAILQIVIAGAKSRGLGVFVDKTANWWNIENGPQTLAEYYKNKLPAKLQLTYSADSKEWLHLKAVFDAANWVEAVTAVFKPNLN